MTKNTLLISTFLSVARAGTQAATPTATINPFVTLHLRNAECFQGHAGLHSRTQSNECFCHVNLRDHTRFIRGLAGQTQITKKKKPNFTYHVNFVITGAITGTQAPTHEPQKTINPVTLNLRDHVGNYGHTGPNL
jgi:hypothetical protein